MEKIAFAEDKLKKKDLARKYVTILQGITEAYTIAPNLISSDKGQLLLKK